MSTIIADNLTGKTAAGSVTITSEGGSATMQLQQGVVKAWITFSGDGTTVRDSNNIASLVDDGTGNYSYNLTSSMSNTHYSVATSSSYLNSTNDYETYLSQRFNGNLSATRTTSQNNIGFWDTSYSDPGNDACSSVLGDLA